MHPRRSDRDRIKSDTKPLFTKRELGGWSNGVEFKKEGTLNATCGQWWCNQPGYIEDPSSMLAASFRLRKKTQEEPVTRSIRFVREKNTAITDKITRIQYRPATSNGCREPQIKRWTDAVFHFSLPEHTQNQTLLNKYDLSFKKPLDSSFTHDKIFHEERIKGATSTTREPPHVDPYAIDKSKKTTRRRVVDSLHRRKKLDEFKLSNGLIAPPQESGKRRSVRFHQIASQQNEIVQIESIDEDDKRDQVVCSSKKQTMHLHMIRDVRTGGFDPILSMDKLQLH